MPQESSPLLTPASKPKKPFPWPLLLAILIPVSLILVLGWGWYFQDYIFILRTGWVSLCSFVPGLFLMVIIGSIAQMRRRPFLSAISVILGGSGLIACYWTVLKMMQMAEDFLK